MAYCVRCGAYIPEGQSVCLACGYDPEAAQLAASKKAAENNTRSGSASAARQYSSKSSNEELRKRLEEQRRRSQEQNRQWAEQEKVRREEQAAREEARSRQQEEDRRWAQEEYERRQAQQRSRTVYHADGSVQSSGEGNKALAALSYLSVLFALPYIFTPQDAYAKYHAKQGLKLFIFGIVADIVGSLIGVGWVITLVRLYLIYKGMSNALNGKKEPLPWIGEIGE